MKDFKLTLGKKLAFASADIFGGGSFNIINFLYPGFLAMTVKLSPYWIALIMFVARLWDAISDPLMGRISDNTNSKFGKRRIYFLMASPLILVAMVLMFFPYSFSSTALRVIAVLASYLLFCTVQTMVMIPYYSFSTEISSDYQERASANSWRLGFSIFSSIVCVAVPGLIVNMFPSESGTGYIVMGITFGVIFAIAVAITGIFGRAEINPPPTKTKVNWQEIKSIFSVKAFGQYLWLFLLLQMTMAIMSSLFFFFVDFYICRDLTAQGKPNSISLIAAALMFSMQIVALPIYLKVIAKKGKTFTYRLGAIIWIISALSILLTKPNEPAWHIFILAAAMGFGISAPGLVPHTMLGDVTDAIELTVGNRCSGTVSGVINFLNKAIQALGLAGVMALIGAFGFVEAEVGAPPLTAQPVSAQLALQFTMALSPLILMTIAIIISYQYKIDAKKQNQIMQLLEKRKASTEDKVDSTTEKEIAELVTELTGK